MNVYDVESTKDIFLSFGYIAHLTNYRDCYEKIFVEDGYGYKYSLSLAHFLVVTKRNGFPKPIIKENPFSFENIKLYLKKENKRMKIIGGEYIDAYEKSLVCECLECGEIWNMSWMYIQKGRECTSEICKRKHMSDAGYRKTFRQENRLSEIFPEISLEWDYSKNNGSPEEYMSSSNKKFWWICPDCFHSYPASIDSRTRKDIGNNCPRCKASKGEKRIRNYLKENNISFTSQFRIKECKYKNTLPFDFAIFNKNDEFQFLIEYQGEQHYNSRFFNGEQGLINTQRNDEIKRKYCEDNNIYLLIIPYWDKNRIDEILDEFFY
jgi:hypothetical protein